MDGRRILGGALAAIGIGVATVGFVGLAEGGGNLAAVEPSVSVSGEPPSASPLPTQEPSAEPTAEPTEEPSPEPAVETPQEFFAALGEAFATGDARFLVSRLHPYVLDRYGPDQCRTSLGDTTVPDYSVEVLGVTEGTTSFVYESDGLHRRVHGATTVRIRFTEDGETFVETDAHIVLDGDRFRWLTDCGTPIAGAA